MNIIMQNLPERIRPLVGFNGWDYCIYWKLSEDQRFLEWMGCCCAGTENTENAGEELLFPVSSEAPCRDAIFPHTRTKPCGLLSQLPTSIPMDSGIHSDTLLSNQYNWVNYPNSLNSTILEEAIGTQVLIPVPGGLVELFVTKQVPEDHQVIAFVTAQCTMFMGQEAVNHSMNMDGSFNVDINYINHVQPNVFFGDEKKGMMTDTQEIHMQFVEPSDKQEQSGGDRDLIKHVVGRSDSLSDCSDQNDDEDDAKYRRRNGKGNQSKNLEAERKRRKKLNDRLYHLRSLVPRISKLDRASILGDAIEFVKDLQKQAKELQDELEEHSDTGNENNSINGTGNNHMDVHPEFLGQNGGADLEPIPENLKTLNGFHVGTSGSGYISQEKQKQSLDPPIDDKPTQQMEPHVEVALIEGNEFFVKVFCEHRLGGFVRLMEAFNTLGMEVIHATVTSHKGLVSNVFKVEKMDSDIVEAEDVRDSLLELTRNPTRRWCEMGTNATSDNGMGKDYQHHLHNHQMDNAYHPHQLHHIHKT